MHSANEEVTGQKRLVTAVTAHDSAVIGDKQKCPVRHTNKIRMLKGGEDHPMSYFIVHNPTVPEMASKKKCLSKFVGIRVRAPGYTLHLAV